MAQHRSIGQKINKTKIKENRLKLAIDWSKSWHKDQSNLIHMLELAIKSDDHDKLCIATGQLKAVTEKRFSAFENVLNKVSDLENQTRRINTKH